MASEPVEQPAGGVGSFFAPVADEDPALNGWDGCSHDPVSELPGLNRLAAIGYKA
jgi:hypothetical protein